MKDNKLAFAQSQNRWEFKICLEEEIHLLSFTNIIYNCFCNETSFWEWWE